MIKPLLLSLLLTFFTSSILNAQIVLIVKNINELQGNIFYGVYDDKDQEVFLELGKQRKVGTKIINDNEIRIEIDSLPAGVYAISIFQDLNSNGKMEKNFIGYPAEPFAFSNNVRPRFRAPKFEEASFIYDGSYLELSILLLN